MSTTQGLKDPESVASNAGMVNDGPKPQGGGTGLTPDCHMESPERRNTLDLNLSDVATDVKLNPQLAGCTTECGEPTLLLSEGGTVRTQPPADEAVDDSPSKARVSWGDDRSSLHVQFEDLSSPSPPLALPPPDRDSPPCSLTSASCSSSEDEDEDEDEEDLTEDGRPPDGGYGWVVVAAAFFTNLIADGITFTFGIIYVELLKYFKEGKSKTAWIGGIFMAMPLLSGPVASYLTDRFGCRRVCMCGALLASLGFVVSSQAQSIEVLILTFGIVSGFGLAMCFVSAVVIVAYYFEKKRSLATGLSVCGSGLGTFIFAPISSALIREYGWRGTTLILAGLFLNICVCGALMRDLHWTKEKSKAQRRDRKMKHRHKRSLKSRSQSLRTATSSVGSLNPKAMSGEDLKRLLRNGGTVSGNDVEDRETNEEISRLCSSVLHLPTFVRNGEKVPQEVLELLSSNQNVYNVLLKNYPGLLIPSRSNSDAGYLNDQTQDKMKPMYNNNDRSNSISDVGEKKPILKQVMSDRDRATQWQTPVVNKRLLNVRNTNAHRHSLTYRGAVLNVKRYRTRATSCPDIYRHPITFTEEETQPWYDCLWDLRDVLVDMVDISHFLDIRFLLFAISNFILYCWYHVPYVFIADKAVEMGFSEKDASFLISILGILNTLGEILLGWLCDKSWANAGVIYAVCMTACGVFTVVVPLVRSYAGLCVVSGGFGLSIAANYSLASIILVNLISLDRFTNAYGLLLFVQGSANLIGPPLAGWLYDISGDYDLSFYLAGIFIIVCGILLVVLPTMKWFKRRSRSSVNTDHRGHTGQTPAAKEKDVMLV